MCNLCSHTVKEHNVFDVQTRISFTKWSRNIPGDFLLGEDMVTQVNQHIMHIDK